MVTVIHSDTVDLEILARFHGVMVLVQDPNFSGFLLYLLVPKVKTWSGQIIDEIDCAANSSERLKSRN